MFATQGFGAVARRVMGTTVIGGMLAATLLAIFLIPATYYIVERFAGKRDAATTPTPEGEPTAH